LTFDAPAATLAQHQPAPAQPGTARAKSDPASVVELTDWAFTDTRSDVTALIFLEQQQVVFDNQLAAVAVGALFQGQVDRDTVSRFLFNQLGTQLLTDRFSINNSDPLQAPLGALLDQEIATDLFLLTQGFSLEFINQVIFQQITINSFVQGIFLQGLPVTPTPIPIPIPISPPGR